MESDSPYARWELKSATRVNPSHSRAGDHGLSLENSIWLGFFTAGQDCHNPCYLTNGIDTGATNPRAEKICQ